MSTSQKLFSQIKSYRHFLLFFTYTCIWLCSCKIYVNFGPNQGVKIYTDPDPKHWFKGKVGKVYTRYLYIVWANIGTEKNAGFEIISKVGTVSEIIRKNYFGSTTRTHRRHKTNYKRCYDRTNNDRTTKRLNDWTTKIPKNIDTFYHTFTFYIISKKVWSCSNLYIIYKYEQLMHFLNFICQNFELMFFI